jgi:hypothetical protein
MAPGTHWLRNGSRGPTGGVNCSVQTSRPSLLTRQWSLPSACDQSNDAWSLGMPQLRRPLTTLSQVDTRMRLIVG